MAGGRKSAILPRNKKKKNAGVGVDFKKVRHKVGKKLPKAKNDTKLDFKAATLSLPSQTVQQDRDGAATNHHDLTLKVRVPVCVCVHAACVRVW
jgi:pre-rRNA-processing protein IPI1